MKKHKKNIPIILKRLVWDLYIGIGKTESKCPLCGINTISNKTNSGFEGGHITADKFLDKAHQLNEFYLYPICSVCNNECADFTIFDYLWTRGRYKQLEKMISAIYKHFEAVNNDELVHHDRLAPKILEYLYGTSRFPAGGGIINTTQIYKLALVVQYKDLLLQSQKLNKELLEINENMRKVVTYDVKTMYLNL